MARKKDPTKYAMTVTLNGEAVIRRFHAALNAAKRADDGGGQPVSRTTFAAEAIMEAIDRRAKAKADASTTAENGE